MLVLTLLLASTAGWAYTGWSHYETPHLKLLTDLDDTQARELLTKLAYFDQLAAPYLSVDADQLIDKQPPPKIVLFKKRSMFTRIVNNRHFAAYTQPALAETTMVVGPDGRNEHLINMLHEYVHYRLRQHAFAYPMWYEEGLATLLSDPHFNLTSTPPTAEVGNLPHNFDRKDAPQMRMTTLLKRTHLRGLDWSGMTAYYLGSAQLMQYLLFDPETREANAAALAVHLEDRTRPLPELLGTKPKRLQNAVRRFARRPYAALPTVTLNTQQQPQITQRPMSETAAKRLVADTARGANPRFAAKLYAQLLADQPADINLLVALSDAQRAFDPALAAQTLARAVNLEPEHPRVLMERALAKLQQCPLDATLACIEQWREAPRYIRAALAQMPDHLNAILWLGITELYGGNPGGAINYLRVAHGRAPWSPKVNYYLGESMRLLGNPRGREHLERARMWAQDEPLRVLAEAALAAY